MRKSEKMILPPITEEQCSLLIAYAKEHGRKWKTALWEDWMHARLTGPLHLLRNTHGPSWLADFRLREIQGQSNDLTQTVGVS